MYLEFRHLYGRTTYARENAVGDTETPLACRCADGGKARSIDLRGRWPGTWSRVPIQIGPSVIVLKAADG